MSESTRVHHASAYGALLSASASTRYVISGLTLSLGALGVVPAAGQEARPFDTATIHMEQNATDEDAEIVLEAKGGDDGLVKLTVSAPDGRTVVDLSAPDASTLGIRQFSFESPEPKDVAGLKAAYPEGAYRFSGVSSAGERFHGESVLSHELPATVSFLHPVDEARNVSTKHLAISWSGVTRVTAYTLELEQEELGVELKATLPASSTRFAVPDEFLHPDKECKLAIGTTDERGNLSVVETTFTTGE